MLAMCREIGCGGWEGGLKSEPGGVAANGPGAGAWCRTHSLRLASVLRGWGAPPDEPRRRGQRVTTSLEAAATAHASGWGRPV